MTSRSSGKSTPARQLRSGLEDKIAAELDARGVPYEYEPFALEYLPAHPKKYWPDFVIPKRRDPKHPIIVEAKGWFKSKDRQKMIDVKRQHPDRDIRLLFSNANNRLSKQSNTTYGMWAEKHGFPWAQVGKDRLVPPEWLNE